MKKDNLEMVTNEKHIVVLNGVEMERDEQGNYHEVNSRPRRPSSFPLILAIMAMFVAPCCFFLSASMPLLNQSKPVTGDMAGSRTKSAIHTITQPQLEITDSQVGEVTDADEKENTAYYTLTVHYRDASSGAALCSDINMMLQSGESFSITSPVIYGYTASQTVVSGIMDDNNRIYMVRYDKNEDSEQD